MHMIKFEILNLAPPTKVRLFISIHVHGRFQLLPTYALIDFQVDTQKFIQEVKINLSAKRLVAPLAISFSDDVQCNVKHELHFDELKYVSKQKCY